MGIGLRGAATNALVVDVDDAAGIDGVIRCPELVAPLQLDADLGRGQLVVGGPGDHWCAQHLQRLFVKDAAHGAGGEHIDVEAVDVLRTNHVGVQFIHGLLHVGVEDVCHPQFGTGRLEMACQAQADMADALDRHLEPGEIVTSEPMPHRRLEPDEHAERGGRRGVAAGDAAIQGGAWRCAHHMAGALGEGLHLGITRARVGGGDVAPAEAVDEIAHGVQQRLALARVRIADDHRLAAAQRQAGQGGFERHPARQAQHVAQGVVVIGVGEHPATAQRRAESRVVDGDDGLETRCLVVAEDHLFVAVEIGMREYGHGLPRLLS